MAATYQSPPPIYEEVAYVNKPDEGPTVTCEPSSPEVRKFKSGLEDGPIIFDSVQPKPDISCPLSLSVFAIIFFPPLGILALAFVCK